MSLKSWKSQYYPITALQASKKLDLVGLVEHAIQKWTGLLPKNLEKHEMSVGFKDISEINGDATLEITDASCSLCRKFTSGSRNGISGKDCIGCPIFESRKGVRCFEYAPNEKSRLDPYGTWLWDDDPNAMIRALRKALKWAKEHQG